MTKVLKASMLAAVCFSLCGTNAFAQSILNQSKDDLLKEFDTGKTLTAPPQFSGSGSPAAQPSWAPTQPGAPAPQTGKPQGANSPPSNPQAPALLGNYGQGPNPSQPQKGLMQRIIEGAMNAVNVTSNDTDGTHVKVPFVNVDVGGQSPGVNVKAPFTKYNTDDGIRIKGPFVDINHGGKGGNKKTTTAPQNHSRAPQQEPPNGQQVPQNGTGEQGSSLR